MDMTVFFFFKQFSNDNGFRCLNHRSVASDKNLKKRVESCLWNKNANANSIQTHSDCKSIGSEDTLGCYTLLPHEIYYQQI